MHVQVERLFCVDYSVAFHLSVSSISQARRFTRARTIRVAPVDEGPSCGRKSAIACAHRMLRIHVQTTVQPTLFSRIIPTYFSANHLQFFI